MPCLSSTFSFIFIKFVPKSAPTLHTSVIKSTGVLLMNLIGVIVRACTGCVNGNVANKSNGSSIRVTRVPNAGIAGRYLAAPGKVC